MNLYLSLIWLFMIDFFKNNCSWFLTSVEVYSPFALVQLIGSSVILATCLFYLDLVWLEMLICSCVSKYLCDFALILQVFHHMDLSVVFTSMGAIISMSNLFIYCYFGRLTTDSFGEMSECLYYDLNWFKLPIKLQKYLVVIIANMQKPVYYHGFEFAILNLRTFIKVKSQIHFDLSQ